MTAYTAGLASWLTQQALNAPVTTMEEAVSGGVKICAHPAIKTELLQAWPAAKFVFDDSGKDELGLVEQYERGDCDVLAMSTL